jgi:hypothetical protein
MLLEQKVFYLSQLEFEPKNEKYVMNTTEVGETYDALMNEDLREMYDKYNVWYSKKDFKEKGESIKAYDKYI